MAKPATRGSEGLLLRVGLVVLGLILAWVVVGWIMGVIWSLIRIAVLLGLLGIAAWFVLIGPPGGDDG